MLSWSLLIVLIMLLSLIVLYCSRIALHIALILKDPSSFSFASRLAVLLSVRTYYLFLHTSLESFIRLQILTSGKWARAMNDIVAYQQFRAFH